MAYYFLRFLHFLHSFAIVFHSLFWRRLARPTPVALDGSRKRIPNHLAVVFACGSHLRPEDIEKHLLQSVNILADWCQVVGIEKLSLYDREGVLLACRQQIHDRLAVPQPQEVFDSDSELDYPTPPLSDYSDDEGTVVTIAVPSLPNHSTRNVVRRRRTTAAEHRPLIIYLLSKASSKAAIAEAASKFARNASTASFDAPTVSASALNMQLEGPDGFPSPDFMIVYSLSPSTYHREPLELHGFPPWQIRLTEIHLNRYRKRHRNWLRYLLSRRPRIRSQLTEIEFREALDEFAEVEMRFGK